ncbi:hypothetical protein [Hymenobacter crusticola]|uniref:Uncharacterized protein n=1 Tax=Hymenobacter crusticola TaxID=1770526 RepID=A0A243W7A4_9BACT|nr:hypothetical protein [Hymenobacter crusticola]OUJ70301.1 hypothetical protein BXP70_24720 [Hymenobacter crusticola]
MKYSSTLLLTGALLLATVSPMHAQVPTSATGCFDFDLATPMAPAFDYRRLNSPSVQTSEVIAAAAPLSPQQQLEQLSQENLALEFSLGLLQTQVELLSRRLATLESAAASAEPARQKAL